MGSKQTRKKRGRNKKNKVENNKIKIKRTYKNESGEQTLFLYTSFLLLFIIFFFLFLFLFLFQQIKRKWNEKNKGIYMKNKINTPYLFETHSQNNSIAPFLPRSLGKTWFSTFWLVMSYKMKEGVKGSKRVTMDINAR